MKLTAHLNLVSRLRMSEAKLIIHLYLGHPGVLLQINKCYVIWLRVEASCGIV
jgi:hypothetical protein